MTDFFSELEGHLHHAARRRARRGPRVVLAVAVAAAVVVAVFAGLSTLSYDGDPEVVAPAPVADAQQDDCARPPQAVLDRFAVLRREPDAEDDAAPEEVLDRLAQDFPGVGLPARVWPEAGRLARVVEGRQFWLFPVLLGKTCQPPLRHTDVPVDRPREPGICWVYVDRETNMAICHPLDDVERVISLVVDEQEPWASGLVPDGRAALGSRGQAIVDGKTIGNIFVAEGATDVADTDPEIPTGCQAPSLTKDEPAPELLETVPTFRQGPLRLPPETWRRALAGQPVMVNTRAARGFGTHAGMQIFGVAYTPLHESCGVDGQPNQAGACLVAAPDRSEYFAHCFTATRIFEGRALVHDTSVGLAYALVPSGIRGATLGGQPMQVEGNFAYLVTGDTTSRMELIR